MKAEDIVVGQEYMWTYPQDTSIKEQVRAIEVKGERVIVITTEGGREGVEGTVQASELTIYLPPKQEIAGSQTRDESQEAENPVAAEQERNYQDSL